MKKRRTIVIAFLLIAALALGIGYAALTDVLDITGKADINASAAEEAFNEDVYFTAAVANEASTGNTASVNTQDNDKASFTAVNLKGKGDKATFTFTIKNAGDVEATVTPAISSNTQAEYFSISSDWAGQAKTLAAGQEITYTVTVELLKTPTVTISGSFIVELTATSVDATSGS